MWFLHSIKDWLRADVTKNWQPSTMMLKDCFELQFCRWNSVHRNFWVRSNRLGDISTVMKTFASPSLPQFTVRYHEWSHLIWYFSNFRTSHKDIESIICLFDKNLVASKCQWQFKMPSVSVMHKYSGHVLHILMFFFSQNNDRFHELFTNNILHFSGNYFFSITQHPDHGSCGLPAGTIRPMLVKCSRLNVSWLEWWLWGANGWNVHFLRRQPSNSHHPHPQETTKAKKTRLGRFESQRCKYQSLFVQ